MSDCEVEDHSSAVVDMNEGRDEVGAHLELVYDHGHHGKVKELGSNVDALEHLVEQDEDRYASVVLRLAACVAMEAARMMQVFHV